MQRHLGVTARSIAVVLAAATAMIAGGAPSGASSSCPTSTLTTGHRIVADTSCSQLRSVGGHFVLSVYDDHIEIDQNVHATNEPSGTLSFHAGPSWSQATYQLVSHRNMALSLRPSGNLVLVSPSGRVLWSTNTAGKGVTRAVLRDNGRLVLVTSSGRVVWGSHSGILALGGGDRLMPGHRLLQATYDWACDGCNQGRPLVPYNTITTSIMQSNGDFVAYCPNSSRVGWHTNTHTPGSFLTLRDSGALVVESPSGRILWSSPTRGWRYAISVLGTQVIAGTSHEWNAPETHC